MSGHGFHVHGAHDHEVERQAQHGPGLAQSMTLIQIQIALRWLP